MGARRGAGGGRRLRARTLPFRLGQRPLPPQRRRRPVDVRRPPAAGGPRFGAARTGGHRWPLRSHGSPRARRSGLRPLLRASRRAARGRWRTAGVPERKSSSTNATAGRGSSRIPPWISAASARATPPAGRSKRCALPHRAWSGSLVDLGGDIAVSGESPEGGPWLVAIADPRRAGETLAVLALDAGGVATSGRDARRFGPARSLHHLIDPDTGESALGGPLTVTVVAPDPVAAEVHATTLAIAGAGEAKPMSLPGRSCPRSTCLTPARFSRSAGCRSCRSA